MKNSANCKPSGCGICILHCLPLPIERHAAPGCPVICLTWPCLGSGRGGTCLAMKEPAVVPSSEVRLPMKLGISILAGRISPVFDVARQLLVVDVDSGREAGRLMAPLDEARPVVRARQVAALGVKVLVCGALSRPLEVLLRLEGIEVVKQRCGAVEEVLQAYISGRLTQRVFMMPGCCRRRRLPGRRE